MQSSSELPVSGQRDAPVIHCLMCVLSPLQHGGGGDYSEAADQHPHLVHPGAQLGHAAGDAVGADGPGAHHGFLRGFFRRALH